MWGLGTKTWQFKEKTTLVIIIMTISFYWMHHVTHITRCHSCTLKWYFGSFHVGLYEVLFLGQCITCSWWPAALPVWNLFTLGHTWDSDSSVLGGGSVYDPWVMRTPVFGVISHNIKSPALHSASSSCAARNSSDRQGLETEQMLYQIRIWAIWGPDQHIWPFVMFLGSFLSSFCGVAEQIFLLGRQLREYQQCLDGCCVSGGTYTNAKTQVFPSWTLHRIEWWMLFTLLFVSIADRQMSVLWYFIKKNSSQTGAGSHYSLQRTVSFMTQPTNPSTKFWICSLFLQLD